LLEFYFALLRNIDSILNLSWRYSFLQCWL